MEKKAHCNVCQWLNLWSTLQCFTFDLTQLTLVKLEIKKFKKVINEGT